MSFAYGMDMADGMASSSMMKDDMKTSGVMMKNDTMSNDSTMYEMVMPTSKKTDITKLQMMLVEKGYLMMPQGVSYGYYGNLTKKAYAKYKKMSMMKKDTMGHDTMMKDSATMNDTGMMSH